METRLQQEVEPVTQQVALLFTVGAPNAERTPGKHTRQMKARTALAPVQPAFRSAKGEQEMQEELSQGGKGEESTQLQCLLLIQSQDVYLQSSQIRSSK